MKQLSSDGNAIPSSRLDAKTEDRSLAGGCGLANSAGPNSEAHHGLLCSLAAGWQKLRTRAPRSPIGARSSQEDLSKIRAGVEGLYSRVATDPEGKFEFHRGAQYAITKLGYDAEEIAAIPGSSTQSFAGVANPHLVDPVRPGEVVLDVGSGSGTDLIIAAQRVGPSGHAIGVDMTEEMIKRSRETIAELGLENVEVRKGNAESLPIDDAAIDVVMSNGVLNLVPDKEQAFREIYRVLRPGGRLLLGDIVVSTTFLQKMIGSVVDLWAVCVAGAMTEANLIELVRRSGFDHVKVNRRFDCVRGTSKEFFARWLGVRGVSLHAVKPIVG